jgi:gliding motility-associated-like protein
LFLRRFLLAILLLATGAFCSSVLRAEGLDFIANKRQWPAEVRYQAALPGGTVFLTKTGFVYSYYDQAAVERVHALRHDGQVSVGDQGLEAVGAHAYRVSLLGCNSASENEALNEAPHYYNFFLGNDSSRWSGNTPAYGHVFYRKVYKGIDLSVYSEGAALKYDFIVAPNAASGAIRMSFEGVQPAITEAGDLLIRTSVNTVREKAPYAYQVIEGKQKRVRCRYALKGNIVSFAFPDSYDHSKELIIDPVLVFATYSGSTGVTYGWSATGDSAGNMYVAGECFSTGWPVSLGAFQTTFGGVVDASINKYSSNGSTLIYSTYYGGDSADYPNTLIVDHSGELIMAGTTRSLTLPVTAGCFDNSRNGGTDVFVARFNASGTGLLGATYLGGSGNEGNVSTNSGYNANRGELISDSLGNIYVAFGTTSGNFPTTAGAFQTGINGAMDAFITKLDAGCSNLIFSTYLGGSGDDAAICMKLRPDGNLVVGGGTSSTNFPGTTAGWQNISGGSTDGFIAVLSSTGSMVRHATYVGTSSFDDVAKLYLDADGNVYATGLTIAGTFPVSPGVYMNTGALNFVIELDSVLQKRIVSTVIGGAAYSPSAFMVDHCGNIYFVGHGYSTAVVPVTADALQSAPGGFWMAVLNPGMTSLRYASFFGEMGDHIDGGSSRLDPNGIVYHAVCTNSSKLPTTAASYAPTLLTQGYDIAAWKFSFGLSGMTAAMDIGPDSLCAPATISPQNHSAGALSFRWDFGDGSAGSTLHTPPPHTYSNPGQYTVKLYTYNRLGCQPIDSAVRSIQVFDRDTVKLVSGPLTICGSDSLRIHVKPTWAITVSPERFVNFQPIGGTEILFSPDRPTSYVITATSSGYCHIPPTDTLRVTLYHDTSTISPINPFTDTLLCNRDTAIYTLTHKVDFLSIQPSVYYSISSDSQTIRFFPPATMAYQLTTMSRNACDTIRELQRFNVSKIKVTAAFELSPKLTDQNEPNFKLSNRSKDANSYEWYLNDKFWSVQTHQEFSTNDTGTYCFTLIGKNDFCLDTAMDCGRLIETHIYMPNAFTPNGDGKNDDFIPIVMNARVLEFSIYNRYGERIFTSFENRHAWDGTYGGKQCDMGTYYYQLRYQILNREPQLLKGDVTLVR